MRELARRSLLLGSGALIGALGAHQLHGSRPPERPTFPVDEPPAGPGGVVLDDASGLSATRVARHVTLVRDPGADLNAALRAELADCHSSGRPFMASAARHSMGGQSLPSDGVAATLAQDWLEPDLANATYRVAAGARWHTVIERLDTLGFSPAVMQSNSDFGIAGTFCVNAHGWPAPFGPFGSTVRSVKIMLADGELVTCSRDENRTLFQASLGGYGLTGIVTELELEMIPNVRLEPDYQVVPAEQFGRRMVDATTMDRAVRMVFGRMNIALDSFMDEAVLVVYRRTADQDGLPSVSRSSIVGRTTREILRRQHDSERMKDLRWWIETELAPALTGGPVTRNSLLSEPVATLANNDPTRTDILHEYFVAPARFADFVAACRQIIPSSYQSLLNVTLRYVAADRDSVLAYAPAPRIAAVMLFSQERTVRAEADMRRMTRTLIDAVLGLGGTYYLPYRPHATKQQCRAGYVRVPEFVSSKRTIDPALVFRNRFWDRYLSNL